MAFLLYSSLGNEVALSSSASNADASQDKSTGDPSNGVGEGAREVAAELDTLPPGEVTERKGSGVEGRAGQGGTT